MSETPAEARPGRLFVVATPIGNLEDITLRALRILREAELVLAEDTRRTKILLAHHAITTPLASLHAHTPGTRIAALADELAAGRRYALVTDAGTPLVSDPGGELVRAAVAREVAVEAIPGASAVLTALCVAGLRADHFRFVGFLPRSGAKRRTAISAIARDAAASVLFESPNRLQETLLDLAKACGDARRAAVCRELTKLHEEIARGTLDALAARFTEAPRGEISVVIEGQAEDAADADDENDAAPDVDALLASRLRAGIPAKEVAKELALLLDIDKREAYRRVVEHRVKATS